MRGLKEFRLSQEAPEGFPWLPLVKSPERMRSGGESGERPGAIETNNVVATRIHLQTYIPTMLEKIYKSYFSPWLAPEGLSWLP